MRNVSSLSVRLSQDLTRRLEKLAKTTEHSKSFLAAQAIEEFVSVQEWQVEAIKEGIAAAERGEVVSHEEALAELRNWGRKRNAA